MMTTVAVPSPPGNPASIKTSDTDSTCQRQRSYEQYIRPLIADVYRFVLWLKHDPETAHDILQETLLRAWRSYDSLCNEANSRPWLMTIARRQTARRFERPRLPMIDIAHLSASQEPSVSEYPGDDRNTAWGAVMDAIGALETLYQDQLVLQALRPMSANAPTVVGTISLGGPQ